MRAALFTKEFPPHIYGGAGVHVDYLSRELAKKIEVEVHCWGKQHSDVGRLHVRGQEPWDEITNGTTGKVQRRTRGLQPQPYPGQATRKHRCVSYPYLVCLNGRLSRQEALQHPFRAHHALSRAAARLETEQLGSGYALSSWMERTAILDADAIIAVSNGTKAEVLSAYDVLPAGFTSSTTASTSTSTSRPPTPGRLRNMVSIRCCLRALRRPHHAAEGRHASGRCHPHLPPGTQIVLCAGAPNTPEIAAEMRDKVEGRGTTTRYRLDREDGHPSRDDPALLPRPVFCCPQSTNPLASSTWKRWPAALRSSPAPRAESSKWLSMERPAISYPSSRTR